MFQSQSPILPDHTVTPIHVKNEWVDVKIFGQENELSNVASMFMFSIPFLALNQSALGSQKGLFRNLDVFSNLDVFFKTTDD